VSDTSVTRKDSPWLPALLAAVILVYGPLLWPAVAGRLGDMAETYWKMFPIIPGALAGAFIPEISDRLETVVSGLASGAIFLLVAQGWRGFNRKGRIVLALLCVAGFSLHAYGFTNALRA
jgi:hypothetical protein